MTDRSPRDGYAPGPAAGASIQKDGEGWTLVLVRELRHPPAKVWLALTDPVHLREWAPFDADRKLTSGAAVKLSTVGTPAPQISETTVTRAEEPTSSPAGRGLLEYNWGGNELRWQLEPLGSAGSAGSVGSETAAGGGTRLTLWHNIDRRYIAMGAAGWHICFDVLDRLLDGAPIGRLVAADALNFGGWQRLHAEYARQFGVETPK